LDDIEAGDAGFLNTEPGIFERRLFELGNGIRFYADMNVNDEHELPFDSIATTQVNGWTRINTHFFWGKDRMARRRAVRQTDERGTKRCKPMSGRTHQRS
jgi:hypothetical protein